ncbi:MAG: NAD-dependent epimerase/dehydratase family protein, partial [Ghiorsea sp.]
SFIRVFKDKYAFLTFSLLKSALEELDLDNVDTVLHCAALVHQREKCTFDQYHDINVKYTLALATKAKESGVKQFVFISTIAVYGEGKTLVTEDTTCAPTTPYSKSKLVAEIELQKLEDMNFTVSIIRPPMIYGLNAPGNMAALISLVSKSKVLPFANIENRRSFVYICNLINLIDRVIVKSKGGVFLAGDDEYLSTTRLIELIAKGLDRNVFLVALPFFRNILKMVKPSLYASLYSSLQIDNKATKQRLGFKNQFEAEKAIRLVVQGKGT